jgi:RNA recognition motif-containing protein
LSAGISFVYGAYYIVTGNIQKENIRAIPVKLPQRGNIMNIFLKDISPELNETKIKQIFTAFGEVVQVEIKSDKPISGRENIRHAYIEMAVKSEGVEAIRNLNGKVVSGRIITAIEALPFSKKARKP